MADILTDAEILDCLNEPKVLPDNYRSKVTVRPKRGHKERELEIMGEAGTRFVIVLRQAIPNPLDFSVILGCFPKGTNQLFRLRRFNGKSHEHTNKIEGTRFYDFHIHQATQRYQESGLREDAFAEPTNRYQDLHGALRCLIEDCGFRIPDNHQPELFETP